MVVAAAGNDGLAGDPAEYPAAIPGVVAVTASDRTGALWPQSESGPFVSLTAPGVDIYTTGAQGTRSKVTGTSFAAPQVAAAAALLRARYPTETAAQIVERLITTSHGREPRDPRWGYGIVDPYRALTLTAPPAAGPVAAATVSTAVATSATARASRKTPVLLMSVGATVTLTLITVLLALRRRRARE